MTQNLRRSLANRCNALKSTGPRSVAGKRTSSQNSRKHGLNSVPDFESSIEYQTLVDLIAEEGFSAFACADIAAGLLNYRRVMDAYYHIYSSPEPVDEFLRDANVKASNPIFSELLSPSGSEPQDVREMVAFFASMQRQERRKGGPASRRSADTHKLIRYQRNGIARLSRAIRQG
ncbi:hypothetical protein U062_00705 [Gammaproteobacteria bacterium MOLA455]|nr:hypothetical protein U062_00705 [Gammaproteobacteria bacterium MOLA455]